MYFKNITDVIIDVDGSGTVDLMKNLTAKSKISDSLINNAGFYETITIQDGERPDHLSQRLYGSPQYHWTFLLLNPQIKNIWDDWPMKYSQLVEYCINKYQYLAGDVTPSVNNDLTETFTIGSTVTGGISGATGIVKEVHVNLGYVVIERTTGQFAVTGESITGGNSQESVSCNFIKPRCYAPHHHVDDGSGEWVTRREAGTTGYSLLDYEAAITEQNRNIKVIKPSLIRDVASQFIKTMQNA